MIGGGTFIFNSQQKWAPRYVYKSCINAHALPLDSIFKYIHDFHSIFHNNDDEYHDIVYHNGDILIFFKVLWGCILR